MAAFAPPPHTSAAAASPIYRRPRDVAVEWRGSRAPCRSNTGRQQDKSAIVGRDRRERRQSPESIRQYLQPSSFVASAQSEGLQTPPYSLRLLQRATLIRRNVR